MRLTKEKLYHNIPFFGILIFVGLYIYSSTLYPGGSQAGLNSEGFDWINNYWCDLMKIKGLNGEINTARPFAIFAMTILCISFMFFFIQFAETFSKEKIWKKIIKVNGIISMIFAIMIFTEYHDLMIMLSSLFGLFVVVGIIREIYKSDLTNFKMTGVLGVLSLVVTNFLYYSEYFEWLPLIQKIAFVIVLLWVVGLNYEMNKNEKHSY